MKRPVHQSKSLPYLLLLSVMAHIAHPPCNYPLHFAVSDYVDSHSDSFDLLQLLSRLGVCSSRHTFQRVKTRVVSARVSAGLGEEVLTGAFSITSIDNIDRAAPGQWITQAGQSRGFHGTSVQHVAPKPLTCRLTEEEQPSKPMATVSTAGVFTAGVRSTPAPHSRTLRVSVATASSQLFETVDHSVLNAASTQDGLATVTQADIQQISTPLYRPPQTDKRPLTEEVVELTNAERVAMKELQGRIFSYMVARRQAGVEGTECQGLKDFLAMQVPDASEEESVITTQGVLPELADNQDTVKAILDNLSSLYGIGTHAKTHMVVGDQKIFMQMQRLKRQYGADLDWLLPYPGDWHVLKNFQPVLARLYFHAGLQQTAKEAGYKGSNLTALETCSHFKHTHVCLLEAYESIYVHGLST